jgi:hypothetical protein
VSWPVVALLLLGCALFGALLGTAPSRVRTGWLVAGAVVAAFFVFLPGICATAIAASVPYGDPELLDGITTCRFLYGTPVPELGPLDGDETARLLQLIAAVLSVAALLLVRRRRSTRRDDPAAR